MFQRVIVAFFALTSLSLSAASISGVTVPSGTVPQYSKYEISVALTTSALTSKYFEARPASGGIDLSATFTNGSTSIKVFGFWDGSAWKIRFAPTLTGTWTYAITAIDADGTLVYTGDAQNILSFQCNPDPSNNPGFAQINGQYLKFSTGQSKFVVGVNNGWQYDVEQPSLATMKSNGLNVLSFWMNSPWVKPTDGPDSNGKPTKQRTPIENIVDGIGNYNQGACAYIDGVVDRADAAGVYLLPSIWSHGNLRISQPNWGAAWWTNNAYSNVCSICGFFQTADSNGAETPQWGYQQNYFRYILARWGYSRAVLGFVSVVELDGCEAYVTGYRSDAEAWTLKVRDYFAANDPYRTNSTGQYPVCATKTDWDGSSQSWNGGDLFGIDCYTQQTSNTAVAQAVGSETVTMRSSGRPVFDAEFGGDTKSGATEPMHMHNGIWAGTASGACMSPLKWCDGGSWPMLTDQTVGAALIAELQRLSTFTSNLGYIGSAGYGTVAVTPSISGTCRGWGMGISDKGFAWVQNLSGTNIAGKGFKLSIPSGTYNVFWFDPATSTSTPYSTQVLSLNSSTALTVPSGATRDVVCQYFLNSAPQILSINAPDEVTANSAPASVMASDDAGESALTYTWSATGPAAVTFNPSGTNAAKNTIATFTKAGTYQLTVVAKDKAGQTTSATKTITVLQTPTSISVTPASVTLLRGASAQFSAQLNDQFNAPIAGSPTFTWTATGGTITGTGLYTAGTSLGVFGVDAAYQNLTGHASVTIVSAPPTITSAASATPNPVSKNTYTTLSVSASDDGGAANLTYTWAASPATGATFTSTSGATTKVKFSNRTTYRLTVTVKDAEGNSVQSFVDVKVN